MKILHLTFILLSASICLAGCASKKQYNAVKEIYLCSSDKCESAEQQYSTEQLLQGFKELLQNNANVEVSICNADPQKRTCKSRKVCYLVLGGLLPGNGCSKYLMFNDVNQEEEHAPLTMKTKMPLSFLGTPVQCATASGIFTVNSSTDISLQLKPHFCSWMVVGAMTAQFNFKVESINLDNAEIGGYWEHKVRGTGNGTGSGYLILKFPKNIVWPKVTTKNFSANP